MSDFETPRNPRRGTFSSVLGAVLFVVAMAAAASLGWWLGRQRSPFIGESSTDDVRSARAYRDFRLPSLEGGLLGPTDLDAEVVVLDFWATWCRPCAVQAEILRPIQADYADEGVGFLSVNLGEEESIVRSYVEREPFPYPTVLDEDAALSDSVGVFGLPTLVVLGAGGEVLLESVGLTGASQLRSVIEKALAE